MQLITLKQRSFGKNFSIETTGPRVDSWRYGSGLFRHDDNDGNVWVLREDRLSTLSIVRDHVFECLQAGLLHIKLRLLLENGEMQDQEVDVKNLFNENGMLVFGNFAVDLFNESTWGSRNN